VVHVPHCNGDKVNYLRGKKHLVILNRLVYRTPKLFLDFLVNRFALPPFIKLEACIVLERQDRIVSELSQIFNNDYLVIMKDPTVGKSNL
jgi:hypothetical protein